MAVGLAAGCTQALPSRISHQLEFPARAASADPTGNVLQGRDVSQSNAGSANADGSFELTPDELAFAVYRFNVDQLPRRIRIYAEPESDDTTWIASADYSQQRWSYSGPYPVGSGVIDLPLDPAQCVSPEGNIYIAVIASGAVCLIQQLELVTSGGWQDAFPPPYNGLVLEPSLAVVEGAPAIAYRHINPDGFSSLAFVRATDSTGTSWQPPLLIDTAVVNVWSPMLVVIGGQPAIAYIDSQAEELQFLRALDSVGETWAAPLVVAKGDIGYCSLTEVAGTPALAYLKTSTDLLYYVRASTPGGISWTPPQSVDAAGAINYVGSMLVAAGAPAICYSSNDSLNLKYVRAEDAFGEQWADPEYIVFNSEDLAAGKMALVDGHPAVCYQNIHGYFRYRRALDAAGNEWPATAVGIGQGANGATDLSFTTVAGFPAISFVQNSGTELCYMRARNYVGSAWLPKEVLREISVPSSGECSLADVGQAPAIAFSSHNFVGEQYAPYLGFIDEAD